MRLAALLNSSSEFWWAFSKVSNTQARVKSKLEEHKREQNTIHGSTEHHVLGREQSMGFPV